MSSAVPPNDAATRGRSRGRGRPRGRGTGSTRGAAPASSAAPVERKRREGGNYNPAQVVIDSSTTRRSSAQVKADALQAASEAEAAKKTAEAQALEKRQRVARLEDIALQKETTRSRNVLRPDLTDVTKGLKVNAYSIALKYTELN